MRKTWLTVVAAVGALALASCTSELPADTGSGDASAPVA